MVQFIFIEFFKILAHVLTQAQTSGGRYSV